MTELRSVLAIPEPVASEAQFDESDQLQVYKNVVPTFAFSVRFNKEQARQEISFAGKGANFRPKLIQQLWNKLVPK